MWMPNGVRFGEKSSSWIQIKSLHIPSRGKFQLIDGKCYSLWLCEICQVTLIECRCLKNFSLRFTSDRIKKFFLNTFEVSVSYPFTLEAASFPTRIEHCVANSKLTTPFRCLRLNKQEIDFNSVGMVRIKCQVYGKNGWLGLEIWWSAAKRYLCLLPHERSF